MSRLYHADFSLKKETSLLKTKPQKQRALIHTKFCLRFSCGVIVKHLICINTNINFFILFFYFVFLLFFSFNASFLESLELWVTFLNDKVQKKKISLSLSFKPAKKSNRRYHSFESSPTPLGRKKRENLLAINYTFSLSLFYLGRKDCHTKTKTKQKTTQHKQTI